MVFWWEYSEPLLWNIGPVAKNGSSLETEINSYNNILSFGYDILVVLLLEWREEGSFLTFFSAYGIIDLGLIK